MHGHDLTEALAAGVLVLLGAFFVPASWLAARRARAAGGVPISDGMRQDRAHRMSGGWNAVAAGFALGAAAIHLAVVAEHMTEYPLFGQAFAILGVVQVLLALGLVSRTYWIRGPAIAIHVAVVAVWGLSRTIGLPIGPHPFVPEAIGMADAVATAFEVGLVALIVASGWRDASRDAQRPASGPGPAAVVPAIGVIGLITLVAIASLAGGAHAPHV